MDQRLHQIRLVTERYRDLQGLRLAWGGFVFAIFGSVLFLTGWTRDLEVLAVLFTMAAVIAPGLWLLGRYYRGAFGRLVSGERDKVLFWPAMAIPVGAAIARNSLELGPVGACAPFVAAFALWITIRDWPLRAHHVLPFAGATLATALQLLTVGQVPPSTDGLTMILIGAAYIPTGLLDHRLLTSVMKPGADEAGLKSCATGTASNDAEPPSP